MYLKKNQFTNFFLVGVYIKKVLKIWEMLKNNKYEEFHV